MTFTAKVIGQCIPLPCIPMEGVIYIILSYAFLGVGHKNYCCLFNAYKTCKLRTRFQLCHRQLDILHSMNIFWYTSQATNHAVFCCFFQVLIIKFSSQKKKNLIHVDIDLLWTCRYQFHYFFMASKATGGRLPEVPNHSTFNFRQPIIATMFEVSKSHLIKQNNMFFVCH